VAVVVGASGANDVKEEAKLLHMLSVTRYSKFVWSILRSRAVATWGQGVPHDRRERSWPKI
jgi:hypothetical protein